MPKVKDAEIKTLSTTKQDFYSALKKVSQRIDKPIELCYSIFSHLTFTSPLSIAQNLRDVKG